MTGGVQLQVAPATHNCTSSRSAGRSQGRRQPACFTPTLDGELVRRLSTQRSDTELNYQPADLNCLSDRVPPFTNNFTTPVLPTVLLGGIGTQALAGLCGGMSFAALDYFNSALPVPTHASTDYPAPDYVPVAGTKLWEFILRRHLASVGVGVVPVGVPVVLPPLTLTLQMVDSYASLTFIQMSATPTLLLRPSLTTELGKVKAAVLAGTPVPIVLVDAAGIQKSHQVVVTGFDDTTSGSVTLFVYDCRFPRKTWALTVTPASATCVQNTPGESPGVWKAFFVNKYAAVQPTYQDWGLVAGLSASLVAFPGSRRFNMSFTARNLGEVSARAGAMTVDISPARAQHRWRLPVPSLSRGTLRTPSLSTLPASMANENVIVVPGYTDEVTRNFIKLSKGLAATSTEVSLTVPQGFRAYLGISVRFGLWSGGGHFVDHRVYRVDDG